MSDEYQWRRKFIEVVEEVFRDLQFDPPPMTHDPDASLVMELDVDGTTFEVVHNPRAKVTDCLIEARLGPITSDQPDRVLTQLLVNNLELARQYGGTFAADIKDDTMLYSFSIPLAQSRGDSVLHSMRETAVLARDWRMALSGTDPEPGNTVRHISPALA